MAELFWWAEDTEYLQWRIPQAGYPMRVVGDALVRHDAIRHGDGVPVWKYYYEARNMLYVHMYVKKRIGYYPRNIAKLLGRAVLREPEGRMGPPAGHGPRTRRRGPRPARHPVPHRVHAGAHPGRPRRRPGDDPRSDGPRTISDHPVLVGVGQAPTRWAGTGLCSKMPAHTAPADDRFPANTGCRCSGFQVGRDSMSVRLEGQPDRLAVGAEPVGVDR